MKNMRGLVLIKSRTVTSQRSWWVPTFNHLIQKVSNDLLFQSIFSNPKNTLAATKLIPADEDSTTYDWYIFREWGKKQKPNLYIFFFCLIPIPGVVECKQARHSRDCRLLIWALSGPGLDAIWLEIASFGSGHPRFLIDSGGSVPTK